MLKSKYHLKPIGNRVLIKPLQKNEDKSQGGIHIPEPSQRKGQVGEVVGVGAKCKSKLAVGDVVIITHHRGHEVEFAGEKYELLREDDVYGTLHKESK